MGNCTASSLLSAAIVSGVAAFLSVPGLRAAGAGVLTVQAGGARGALFAHVSTNTVFLSGTNTVANSERVLVNGSDAAFDSVAGAWSKSQALTPGYNRLVVEAADRLGNVLASTNQAVVAELASTFVGGLLGSNTTWTSSMGTVHVTNHLAVPAGGALTIQEGTVVLLGPDVSIRATNASFTATGSTESPVCFLPEDGATPWGELLSVGAKAQLVLQHAEMAGGHVEILEGATGLLEDSYLHDYIVGTTPIVHTLRAASLTVRRCHVARYHEQLLQLTPVLFEDCLCENINGDGIDFDGAPPGSTVRGCTLRYGNLTNVDGVDVGQYPNIPCNGVTVENCLLYGFPFDKGVSIGEAAQNITVRNCVIYSVDIGVAVKDSSRASIYNNTIADSNFGLRFYEKIAGRGPGHAVAFNNILWGNTNSIVLLDGSTITITNSLIAGNTIYPGAGNINADPLFLGAAQRDYRLAIDSPAIGHGAGGTNLGALFPVGSSLVDTDRDRLPDPWELANGLNPNAAGDAALDPDGDGLKNYQEFLAGTNPLDAESNLHLQIDAEVPNLLRIRFQAVGGKSYSLLVREDLTGSAWTKLTNIAPQAATQTIPLLDSLSAANQSRFYEVRTPALP
ncbi:MAG: right-handed parallel beta-helix repeat-containing protein [Verrucomicrobiota bacterium]